MRIEIKILAIMLMSFVLAGTLIASVSAQTMTNQLCYDDTSVRITFIESSNTLNGNLEEQIFVGSNQNPVNSSDLILIAENGRMIVDDNIQEDVPGISIQRLDGRIRFLLYGSHNDSSLESMAVKIELNNAVVSGFQNDLSNAITQPNRGNRVDNQGDGIFNITNIAHDEVFYTIGEDEVKWYSSVIPANDGFYLDIDCGIENDVILPIDDPEDDDIDNEILEENDEDDEQKEIICDDKEKNDCDEVIILTEYPGIIELKANYNKESGNKYFWPIALLIGSLLVLFLIAVAVVVKNQ
jgi:hypothetical protein